MKKNLYSSSYVRNGLGEGGGAKGLSGHVRLESNFFGNSTSNIGFVKKKSNVKFLEFFEMMF